MFSDGHTPVYASKVMIERVDIVVGGDHGQGAFQAGCQDVVVFAEESETPTVIFDIGLAEVICRKDNAKVLENTIEPFLTRGFGIITENKLTIGLNEEGEIACVFGDDETLQSKTTPQKEMYCVGDFAFYAMILGREHSPGHHCFFAGYQPKTSHVL